MTEIIFGLIIVALIGTFVLYVRETNKEKAKLINALIAKTPEQARDLALADRVETIKQPQETQPNIVPIESVSEEEFDQHIADQLQTY